MDLAVVKINLDNQKKNGIKKIDTHYLEKTKSRINLNSKLPTTRLNLIENSDYSEAISLITKVKIKTDGLTSLNSSINHSKYIKPLNDRKNK